MIGINSRVAHLIPRSYFGTKQKSAILGSTFLRLLVAPPPTHMSIMSTAARTRSSSADIRGGMDERLSKIPKLDEDREKTCEKTEEGATEESNKPKPKVVITKKDARRSKPKAPKPPAVTHRREYEEEEIEEDGHEGESQWDANAEATERENSDYGGSEMEEEGFNLGTAYEILKFRTTEPATRA